MYIEKKKKSNDLNVQWEINVKKEIITMANQKQMRETRENLINQAMNVEFAGFETEGLTNEGVLLYNAEVDAYAVVKIIVKKEDFDANGALEDYVMKLQARAEREAKQKEKVAKAKAKKEEQGE